MKWILPEVVSEEATRMHPDVHPVMAGLLWQRGIRSPEEAARFLQPDWQRDHHDPHVFTQMSGAVSRVFFALERGEPVVIHGDYDADGVSGTAVLFMTLRELCRVFSFDEKKISFFLPHREQDGYGFSEETAERLCGERGAKLIITVDCGVSNAPAIARASALGCDTIVCDHHAVPELLPQAILLHPGVPGEVYPNKTLCGCGVAFQFACALLQEARKRGATIPDGREKWLLDLVAIATVTDMMPLVGENRALEHFGLKVLQKTRHPGLRALLDLLGHQDKPVTTTTIGFHLGPRLNAAGRMRHAEDALRLLIAEDAEDAATRAATLHTLNQERQQASDALYREARSQAEAQGNAPLLVSFGHDWSHGLLGLVAGKLQSDFCRPVVVAGERDGVFVGSGRSLSGFDITKALADQAQRFEKFGGHPQACGFTVRGEELFLEAMDFIRERAKQHFVDTSFESVMTPDLEVPFSEITWELETGLRLLEPFGEGNRAPLFLSRRVMVIGMRAVGEGGKHLKLDLKDPVGGQEFAAIGFGLGEKMQSLRLGAMIDVVWELSVNIWKEKKSLQLQLRDFCVCS